MAGLNLHQVVRAAINAVHPDESVTLYRSTGQVNVLGKVVPQYAAPQTVQAQVQSTKDAVLEHADRVGQNSITRNMYLFADPALPPAGVVRPLARGGDMVQRGDGSWWLVTAVPEDFSASTGPAGPPVGGDSEGALFRNSLPEKSVRARAGKNGWVCVQAVQQHIKPDFSASDWWEVTP